MQTRNSPAAYGFLAGAFVLILGLFVNASCAPVRFPEEIAGARTPAERNATAVGIYTECGSGSGVLVDGAHVLTAYHVVDCGDDDGHKPAQYIVVRTAAGATTIAVIQVGDPARDLARLQLATPVKNVAPAYVRTAKVGDVACASTVVPEIATRCGKVTAFEQPRMHGDVTVSGMNVWYGNSGSGAYGKDGALIGIVVRLKWCSDGDGMFVALTGERVVTCGGRVSSIVDSPVNG